MQDKDKHSSSTGTTKTLPPMPHSWKYKKLISYLSFLFGLFSRIWIHRILINELNNSANNVMLCSVFSVSAIMAVCLFSGFSWLVVNGNGSIWYLYAAVYFCNFVHLFLRNEFPVLYQHTNSFEIQTSLKQEIK